MQSLNEYIKTFDNPRLWFREEVNKPKHRARITNVIENKRYLDGCHDVLSREDSYYKGKMLTSRKTVIQYLKTILGFHATYLFGKPVTLTGDEQTVKRFNEIYRTGNYDTIDYQILDRVNKFGDAYECVYIQDMQIKSKILDSADCFPVYNDFGEYLCLIEHWRDIQTNVSYWNIYYPSTVERWCDDGNADNVHMYKSDINVCGLPIHYHSFSDKDYNFGESIITDLKPLLDELEDIYSKFGDAIYVNSLNPLPVSTGVRLDSAVPADAAGYVLNMELGSEFKVVSTTMDNPNIKFYIESLKTMINEIACIPAVLSNAEVANISEMSMKMLFHLSTIKAMENEKWLTMGMQERFKKWRNLLSMMGQGVSGEYVGVEFNLNQPIDTKELFENLRQMYDMGAISRLTIQEKSDLIKDTSVEMERIREDAKTLGIDKVTSDEDGSVTLSDGSNKDRD